MTFVFFILVPYVQRLSAGAISFGQTLRDFLKTPVIIAIFLGIAPIGWACLRRCRDGRSR